MSNRKRELAKSKSEFEVRVRESMNSMSRYLTMHRPCMDEGYELQDGSILEDIRKRGYLRKHQIMAWMKWYGLVMAAHGRSDAMTVSYNERVDTFLPSNDEDTWFGENHVDAEDYGGSRLSGYAISDRLESRKRQIKRRDTKYLTSITPAGAQFQEIWEFLREEERGLVEQLTRDYYRASGEREIHAPTLPTLGFILSGYRDNRQQIAAGVTAIQRLLNSVAQFYRLPIFSA